MPDVELTAWPSSEEDLIQVQARLAEESPRPWLPEDGHDTGGCFACFERGVAGRGSAGDRGWSGAAVLGNGVVLQTVAARGTAGGPYMPGLLALREGPLLVNAVGALRCRPDVLLVNATGLDHPRRAGLAVHLGAVLDIPTVGVTHRPLLATGDWPDGFRGARTPLVLDGAAVGAWLRTVASARPVAVHPGWRTDLDAAVHVVLSATGAARTPQPFREARRVARLARARDTGMTH